MHRNIGMAIANVHLGYYKGKTMKSMKTSKIIVAIVAATALGLGAAQATQINGTVGFTSATNHPGGPGGGIVNNGGGSFTLNFNNPLSVNFGTDDYSGVPIPTDVNFSPITFQNGVGLTGTNVPEWTFTVGTGSTAVTYSFDLLSLSVASFHDGGVGKPSGLNLMGDGIAHITGFEDTEAIFALEATGNHLSFAILQPSNTAVPAPDAGSTVALLGIGLIAVEGLRYDEVSDALHIPIGSVGPLYMRAKKKMRDVLVSSRA